jgi:hypothetical protein
MRESSHRDEDHERKVRLPRDSLIGSVVLPVGEALLLKAKNDVLCLQYPRYAWVLMKLETLQPFGRRAREPNYGVFFRRPQDQPGRLDGMVHHLLVGIAVRVSHTGLQYKILLFYFFFTF